MSRVRILAAGAALSIAAGLGPTPARACDNIFVPCQTRYELKPDKPRRTMSGQPVTWETQVAPTYRVAVKSPTRRIKKKRVRNKRAGNAVASIRPASKKSLRVSRRVIASVPAKPVEQPDPATPIERSVPPVAIVDQPALKMALPASGSIPVTVPAIPVEQPAPTTPVEQPAQPRPPEAAEDTDPAQMLLAVVDARELNEIDLAAGPVASAVVKRRKDHDPSTMTSIAQLLAMLGGALAVASILRAVWA